MSRATVIGAGSWGTALAKLLAEKGHRVHLWCFEESVAEQIRSKRENLDYLPGIALPEALEVSQDHRVALEGAELVVAVVPTQWFREIMAAAAPFVPDDAILVTATKGIEVDTFIQPLREVDRALLEGDDDGFVKVHVQKGKDRIVGATIVARHAGDLISEITLAMTHGLGLKRIGSTIHPYPTQAEAIRKLGDQFNRTRLTPLVKSLFQRWLSWTR